MVGWGVEIFPKIHDETGDQHTTVRKQSLILELNTE